MVLVQKTWKYICGDSCLASVSDDTEVLVLGVGMYMLIKNDKILWNWKEW